MNLNMFQKQVQQQKLILTPQMRQSLKILQMPILDLKEDINKTLEENPLLDVDSDFEDAAGSDDPYDNIDFKEMLKNNTGSDESYGDYRDFNPLDFVSRKKTLKDFLKDQLLHLKQTQVIIDICDYIIENIDERGYLSCSTGELANQLGKTLDDIEYALNLVQQLEPDGIAARNLSECLKIQLDKNGVTDENLFTIVCNHLDLVAENKVRELSHLLHISTVKAQQYFDYIKNLEPKPSRGFNDDENPNFTMPEAYIKVIDGEVVIISNDSILPKLRVNKLYSDIIESNADTKTQTYVKENLHKAINFIKSIEQRNTTIYRVLEALVERQTAYFLNGSDYLKPMTLKDIADELDINESTVSRAINEKYICTPHETIQIKDLFTQALATNSADISSNLVKSKIKELIQSENVYKPLSDQSIADRLKESGIKIARRTVAKYRIEMNIHSSSKRKKYR